MWTKQEDKILVTMWAEGATGLRIADTLQRSRGSVMGRISRLREAGIEIAARPRPPRKKRVYVSKRKIKIMPKVMMKAAVQRALSLPVVPNVPVEESPYRDACDITELRFFSCRYIVQDRPTLYCNQLIYKHSYCQTHFELCYQKGTNAPLTAKPRPAYRNA